MTFDEHVQKRMEKGHLAYGDTSYQRPVAEILDEMLEEFADVAGWGSIALQGTDDPVLKLAIRLVIEGARLGYESLSMLREKLVDKQSNRHDLTVLTRVDGPAGGSIELVHVEGRAPDKELAQLADRFGLEPAALAHYLENASGEAI